MKNEPVFVENLFSQIREIVETARSTAYRAVNSAMVATYWNIGRLIVEQEQSGERRADYGKALIAGLAFRLTDEFGKGFGEDNLLLMRQFYFEYPIPDALRRELGWTHYRLLMRVADPKARAFYEEETIQSNWSTRALERQIHTFFYDRLLASGDAPELREDSAKSTASMPPSPRDFIKDPYILDFLDLKPGHKISETELESLLIEKLQLFLLELGRGFALVDRQKHMDADGQHFYIDLVFYHYLLRRFVLIDLKIGTLLHQDIGQMDFYVRLFDEKFRLPGDEPTIGLILCSEKTEAIVKYSVLQDSNQLFASKFLPSEAELKAELERERMLAELRFSPKKRLKK